MDRSSVADGLVWVMGALSLVCIGAGAGFSLAELVCRDRSQMIRLEMGHTFPVPVSDAFAYITDMKRWGEYWPDFVRIQDPAGARWSQPGDAVTVVLKLLNRERALSMKLEEFRKDTLVTYVSRQRGLPDVWHERHFKSVPAGFEYRLVVAFEPRRGMASLFDRLFLKRAIARALRKTIANLRRVFHDSALR